MTKKTARRTNGKHYLAGGLLVYLSISSARDWILQPAG